MPVPDETVTIQMLALVPTGMSRKRALEEAPDRTHIIERATQSMNHRRLCCMAIRAMTRWCSVAKRGQKFKRSMIWHLKKLLQLDNYRSRVTTQYGARTVVQQLLNSGVKSKTLREEFGDGCTASSFKAWVYPCIMPH